MVTFTTSYGGTVNLGNFENVKLEFSLTQEAANVSEYFRLREETLEELKAKFEWEKRKLLTERE